ncbi:MAG TPA: hypothetical protein VJK52_01425, partial [Candidatus Nanoarchaeia archaeon]|nr:hypothetical protein [Candidatus Nanoarchaeia archaeon]
LDRVYTVGSQTAKRLLEVYPLHVLLQAGVTAYYDFGTSTPSGSNEQPRPFGIIVALELSHPDGYALLIDPMKSVTDHLPVFSYLPNKVRDTIDDRIVSTSRAA